MKIKTHPMNSSNISRAGYDEESKTLEVQFNTGMIYRYDGVPRVMYDEMFKSTSPGGYFRKWIIGGKYKFNKIEKKKS